MGKGPAVGRVSDHSSNYSDSVAHFDVAIDRVQYDHHAVAVVNKLANNLVDTSKKTNGFLVEHFVASNLASNTGFAREGEHDVGETRVDPGAGKGGNDSSIADRFGRTNLTETARQPSSA